MGRLIDADALKRELESTSEDADGTIANYCRKVFAGILENAPTVDAVPIVRCADCKKWDGRFWWCEELECGTERGFFCAHWRKREDGDGQTDRR